MPTFTYDIEAATLTNLTLVRLRINDKYSATPIFFDEEINAFLAFEGDNVLKAAAMALETIAADQVLVLKVIKMLQLSTDGAKVAAELRAQAKQLRDQADDGSTDATFDIAEWVNDPFSYDELIIKQADRIS